MRLVADLHKGIPPSGHTKLRPAMTSSAWGWAASCNTQQSCFWCCTPHPGASCSTALQPQIWSTAEKGYSQTTTFLPTNNPHAASCSQPKVLVALVKPYKTSSNPSPQLSCGCCHCRSQHSKTPQASRLVRWRCQAYKVHRHARSIKLHRGSNPCWYKPGNCLGQCMMGWEGVHTSALPGIPFTAPL